MITRQFIFTALILAFTTTAWAAPIEKPVLYQGVGKARSCLERILLTHTEDLANYFGEWQGPGVRASAAGEVDPSTALYIFQMLPGDKWYAIAFYSQDDEGWRLFTYKEDGRLRIGYHAPSMERTGYLFRVQPRTGIRTGILDDTIPYTEIDLTACEDFLRRF